MQRLSDMLAKHIDSLRTLLNISGVALIFIGIVSLPFDISYRLVVLGLFLLLLWQTLSE